MRVLVVEDVATTAALFESALRAAGMEVSCAGSSAEALGAIGTFDPEIVLLDLELPDGDGIDLVSSFTAHGCGIIVVTATSGEEAQVKALDVGADDYVVKPVMMHELAARVRAVHRRLQGRTVGGVRGARISVDTARRQLLASGGGVASLTEAEMVAFEVLLDAGGGAVSREWISRTALKRPVHEDDRSVDQLVMKLRRKLSTLGCPERTLLSVRRQGYVLADPGLFQKMTE